MSCDQQLFFYCSLLYADFSFFMCVSFCLFGDWLDVLLRSHVALISSFIVVMRWVFLSWLTMFLDWWFGADLSVFIWGCSWVVCSGEVKMHYGRSGGYYGLSLNIYIHFFSWVNFVISIPLQGSSFLVQCACMFVWIGKTFH